MTAGLRSWHRAGVCRTSRQLLGRGKDAVCTPVLMYIVGVYPLNRDDPQTPYNHNRCSGCLESSRIMQVYRTHLLVQRYLSDCANRLTSAPAPGRADREPTDRTLLTACLQRIGMHNTTLYVCCQHLKVRVTRNQFQPTKIIGTTAAAL